MRIRSSIWILAAAALTALAGGAAGETKVLPLDSTEGLEFHKTRGEVAVFKGKKALHVVSTEPPAGPGRRGAGARPAGPPRERAHPLVIVKGVEFHDGTIEVDLAGQAREGAGRGARGFIGVAFRVAPDLSKYEAIYLRPANGRAEDQLRRNHSVQYISFPDYPWFRLRKETPGKYETYADLVPGRWTHVKIVVKGEKARLYLDGNEQPTLLVNDLKLGPDARGAVALWTEPSTDAWFANLRITTQ